MSPHKPFRSACRQFVIALAMLTLVSAASAEWKEKSALQLPKAAPTMANTPLVVWSLIKRVISMVPRPTAAVKCGASPVRNRLSACSPAAKGRSLDRDRALHLQGQWLR